ncbi:MAG: ABC transporter ATP-binding protein [Chloroflexi bacterium]|nr:ABC transporter ATP-binding protein [Chloroflexota bacterium]
MPIIQTYHLTKSYGRARGIVDLNLSVNQGEVFGYLGPNGAGKTTTIRTLLGFLRPTSGRATIFGLDATRDTVAIRRRLGNLPGELALYPNLTGEQLLRYLANLRGGVDWRYVETIADRLDADLSRPIRAYSHGNKQKIGLIQAFMHRPDLLILDEPTTGLDPLVQQAFYELIDEARANGQTVFLSSHILPEVERGCDRVGIIREGRLVTVEHIADLKARALRRLEIAFEQPVPAEAFENLPGVKDVSVDDSRLRCTVVGSLDAVVKTAAQFTVLNIRSEEPNLEEIFLTFYAPNGRTDREEVPHA